MFYSGLVLTLLGALPHYSYMVTFFAIPFIIANMFVNILGYFSGFGWIIWIISGILIIFIPMNWVLVIFWEILLIPLWLTSPLTLTVGIVLLYLSLSNSS